MANKVRDIISVLQGSESQNPDGYMPEVQTPEELESFLTKARVGDKFIHAGDMMEVTDPVVSDADPAGEGIAGGDLANLMAGGYTRRRNSFRPMYPHSNYNKGQ